MAEVVKNNVKVFSFHIVLIISIICIGNIIDRVTHIPFSDSISEQICIVLLGIIGYLVFGYYLFKDSNDFGTIALSSIIITFLGLIIWLIIFNINPNYDVVPVNHIYSSIGESWMFYDLYYIPVYPIIRLFDNFAGNIKGSYFILSLSIIPTLLISLGMIIRSKVKCKKNKADIVS